MLIYLYVPSEYVNDTDVLRSGTGSSGVLTASSSSDKVGEWRTAGELHSFGFFVLTSVVCERWVSVPGAA